jgi:hypothetical protein
VNRRGQSCEVPEICEGRMSRRGQSCEVLENCEGCVSLRGRECCENSEA